MKKYILFILFATNCLLTTAQSPELRIPSAHACEDFAFSADDHVLVTIGENEIKIWDVEGPFLLKTLRYPGLDTLYDKGIFITPDQQRVCLFASGNIRLISLKTLDWEASRWFVPQAQSAGLSNDGKFLYLTSSSGGTADENSLQKMDLSTGKRTKICDFKAEGQGFSGSIEVNTDESMLLASGIGSGGVVFDLKKNKAIHVFHDPAWPMFFNKNGNIISSNQILSNPDDVYAANPQFKVEEWDINTWKSVKQVKVTVKNDDIPDANGIVWTSHNHRDKVLFENYDHFFTVDLKTWTVSPRRATSPGKAYGQTRFFRMSDGGKYGFNNSTMEAFSVETGKLSKKMGFFPYLPFNLTNTSAGTDRSILAGNKMLHFDQTGFRADVLPGKSDYDWLQRSIFRFIPAQKMVLMTENLNEYMPQRYTLGEDFNTVTDIEAEGDLRRSAVEMRVYEDNNTVLMSCEDRFMILDSRTWKQKQHILFDEGYYNAHFNRRDDSYICERSPDRTKVIVHLKNDSGASEIHRIACYDLMQKRLLWKYEEPNALSNAVFAEEGKQVWVINESSKWIKLDAQTGKVIKTSAKIPYADGSTQFSPSGKYLVNFLAGDENVFGITQINVVDAATLQLKFALKQQRLPYIGAIFFDQERLMITQDEDLKIWDTATGKMLARIILIEKGNDWIIATPDGRFDGSPGGLKKMYFIQGRECIPLEQLYEGFFTPNLLNEILDNRNKPSSGGVEINQLKLPPSVRIVQKSTGLRNLVVEEDDETPNLESTTGTVVLSVEADGKTDKITEIRLFHNDKLLNGTQPIRPSTGGTGLVTKEFEVNLLPGENRFRAVAINSQRTESNPGLMTIRYKAAVEEQKRSEGITLHLVVVGINQYKNQKYNLNYAEADATGFKDEMAKNCGSIVDQCQQYFVTNDKAVKAGITDALDKVAASAKAQDVFVLYYAGHGVMADDKEFYLVPHDVTQLYGNDGALAQKGLSATELRGYSTRIKAQKQLFILDACQSSGALETVSMRGAAEEKAIAQLARSTGTHWLTAAGSEQFASEFTQLGHGVFTYVLLEGFKGAADGNKDGKVTVKELDAYLQDQVPVLTQKYKGTPQYPSSYGFGQDFPVGVQH